MRIVAGRWRGRKLVAPSGTDTRPTSDRAREALFSMLEARLDAGLGGCAVLDPFSGSGALALEALSRGAVRATVCDSHTPAIAAIEANVRSLDAASVVRVVRGDAFAFVRSGRFAPGPYGLLLLDPPYRIGAAQVACLLADAASDGLLEEGATVVWEHATGVVAEWPAGFEPDTAKRYGITALDIATYRGGHTPA